MTPQESSLALCRCGNPTCTIPYGFCHCGCGKITSLACQSFTRLGWVRGEPTLFLNGHNRVKPRPVIVQPDDPSIRLIALTQNQVSIVDFSEYERLMDRLWIAQDDKHTGDFYAIHNIRNGNRCIHVRMHHEILPLRDGLVTDHINGYTLDNRRVNLRLVTHSQSMMNRGIFPSNHSGRTGGRPTYRRLPGGLLVRRFLRSLSPRNFTIGFPRGLSANRLIGVHITIGKRCARGIHALFNNLDHTH